jgi:hypothetical protein
VALALGELSAIPAATPLRQNLVDLAGLHHKRYDLHKPTAATALQAIRLVHQGD